MTELDLIGLTVGSTTLFALGGMNKLRFLRRFILPLFLGAGAYWGGIDIIKCIITIIACGVTFSLGYGENSPIWRRVLTILAYSLCLLPLASGWNGLFTLITPLIFGGLYILSRKFNWLSWKLVELSTGFSFGVVTTLLILTKGGF